MDLKELMKNGWSYKRCVGGSADINVAAEAGQTIVAEEVDSNGKPTKWKAVDYQPRTHWEEENVTFLPETTITEVPADGMAQMEGVRLIEEGETYSVTYNGTTYTCVCEFNPNVGMVGFNLGIMMGGEGTGEPFALLAAEMDGVIAYAVVPRDGSQYFTISITGKVVVKIPDKYLSNATKAYYPEFGEAEDGSIVTELTPSKLREQYSRGRAVFLKDWRSSDVHVMPLMMVNENDYLTAIFSTFNGTEIRTVTLTSEDAETPYTVTESIKTLS